jgi:hypothetical protein
LIIITYYLYYCDYCFVFTSKTAKINGVTPYSLYAFKYAHTATVLDQSTIALFLFLVFKNKFFSHLKIPTINFKKILEYFRHLEQ